MWNFIKLKFSCCPFVRKQFHWGIKKINLKDSVIWCHWSMKLSISLCLFWTPFIPSVMLLEASDQNPQPQQNPSPPVWLYIFSGLNSPSGLLENQISVCLSADLWLYFFVTCNSDLFIELQSSPRIHLEYIYLLFYITAGCLFNVILAHLCSQRSNKGVERFSHI